MNREQHQRSLRDVCGITGQSACRKEDGEAGTKYDPELLYVECRYCGKPVLWEEGRTRAIITASGMDLGLLDETCLILSDGCPVCRPGSSGFRLHMVRLTGLSAHDLLLFGEAKGRA